MTARDLLQVTINQRAESILVIAQVARQVFPIGSQVVVELGGFIRVGTVEHISFGGEEATVKISDGDRRPFKLTKLLQWNPDCGTLAEAS